MHLRRCLLLLPLIALGACEPVPPVPEPSGHQEASIISGTPLTPELTRVVKVTPAAGGTCSGTLLSAYWVLTARHCVTTDGESSSPLALPSAITVSLGTVGSSKGKLFAEYPTTSWLDVILIKLESSITSAVPLQLYAGPSLVGSVVRCMGYGEFASGGVGSGTLRFQDFKVASSSGNHFTVEQNAALASPGHGDSGGPCFARDPAGGYFQLAGVMEGFPMGETYKKTLVVRTDTFDAWAATHAFAAPLVGQANTQLVSVAGTGMATAFDFVNIDNTAGLDYVFYDTSKAVVIKSTPTGRYEASKTETAWGSTGWQDAAIAEDVNGDGLADYVYTGDTQLWVAVGKGNGAFNAPVGHPLGGSGWKSGTFIMDVDGVKGADYVQLRGSDVWLSRSSGTAASFPAATKAVTLPAVWDYASTWIHDIDGVAGMELAYVGSSNLSVLLATGGTFGSVVNTPIAAQTGWEPFGDFLPVSADTKADFVAIRDNVLYTQLATSGGAFSPVMTPTLIEWGKNWQTHGTWADMNGDGLRDFAAYDGTHLWVKLSNGLGGFTRLMGQNLVAPDVNAAVRFVDANGDKKADVVFVVDLGGLVQLVTHLSMVSSSAKMPLDEVPEPEPIDLSAITSFFTFAEYWGGVTALERLCVRINCFNFTAASEKADGAGAPGLFATLHGGPDGQQVTGLLPENGRVNGWDWTRYQEAVGAGDLDGDGRDEVVLRDWRGLAFLGRDENTGGPRLLGAQAWGSWVGEWVEEPWLEAWWPLPEDRLVHVGDFDGTPGAELLVQSRSGALGLLKLSAEGVLTALAVYPEDMELGLGPLTRWDRFEGVSDHDGDGTLDVVRWGMDGWTFLRGTPQGLEPWGVMPYGEPLMEDVLTGASELVAVGHLSSSGGPAELLVRGEAGYTLARLVEGQLQCLAFFPWGSSLGIGPLEPDIRLQPAGDVDGDGRDDLLAHSYDGVVLLSVGGDGLEPLRDFGYWQDLGGGWDLEPEDTFQAAGDVDGDGRADLVIRREGLLGVLALHEGDSEWLRWTLPLGPSDDGLSLVQAASVFADLDGDGLRELLVSEVAP